MKTSHCLLLCALWFGTVTFVEAQSYTFTTIAGSPMVTGSADGTNSDARFTGPAGLAMDAAGNLYVADLSNHALRQVSPVGTNWVVRTIAGLAGNPGSADGTNDQARFNRLSSVAVDSAGSLFVADNYNQTIRRVYHVGTNWVVTTIAGMAGTYGSADGTNSAALFHGPQEMALAGDNSLFLTDRLNFTVRRMDLFGTNWVTSTIAGTAPNSGFSDGLDGNASFGLPFGIARHASGRMYVADFGNNAIRQLSPSGAQWRTATVAGFSGASGTNDGSAAVAQFYSPNGIAVDASEALYVTDQYNDTIRKLTPAGNSWTVSTLAGAPRQQGSTDGPAATARFYRPWGILLDPTGNLFVVDSFNQTIRKGTLQTVPPPTLGIFRTASQVVLTWQNSASNFVLQTSAALGGAAAWSPLTNGVVSSGGYYYFTNSLGSGSRFFRLRGR